MTPYLKLNKPNSVQHCQIPSPFRCKLEIQLMTSFTCCKTWKTVWPLNKKKLTKPSKNSKLNAMFNLKNSHKKSKLPRMKSKDNKLSQTKKSHKETEPSMNSETSKDSEIYYSRNWPCWKETTKKNKKNGKLSKNNTTTPSLLFNKLKTSSQPTFRPENHSFKPNKLYQLLPSLKSPNT